MAQQDGDLIEKSVLEQRSFDEAFNSTFDKLYHATSEILQKASVEKLNEKISSEMFAELLMQLQNGPFPPEVSDEFMDFIAADEQTQIKIVNLARSYCRDKFDGATDGFIDANTWSFLGASADEVYKRHRLTNIIYPTELLERSSFKHFIYEKLKAEFAQVAVNDLETQMARRLPEMRYFFYSRSRIQQEFSRYESIIKFDEEDNKLIRQHLEKSEATSLQDIDRQIESFVNMYMVDSKISQIQKSIYGKPLVLAQEAFILGAWNVGLIEDLLKEPTLQSFALILLSLPVLAHAVFEIRSYEEGMIKIDELIRQRNIWTKKQWQYEDLYFDI
jgi:hypothetical protein